MARSSPRKDDHRIMIQAKRVKFPIPECILFVVAVLNSYRVVSYVPLRWELDKCIKKL
jgi:hypothetical protein